MGSRQAEVACMERPVEYGWLRIETPPSVSATWRNAPYGDLTAVDFAHGAGASHMKEWPADQLERGQPCPPLRSISPPSERCPRRSPKAIALSCPRSNRSYLDRGHSCPPHVWRNEENERTRMSAVRLNPAPLLYRRNPHPAGTSHMKEWPADQFERGQPCPPLRSISPPSERCPRRSPKAIALSCPRSNRFTDLRAICEAPALRGK